MLKLNPQFDPTDANWWLWVNSSGSESWTYMTPGRRERLREIAEQQEKIRERLHEIAEQQEKIEADVALIASIHERLTECFTRLAEVKNDG